MKKLLFLIALAAITTVGCATGSGKANSKDEAEKSEAVSQGGDEGGSSLITKDEFLKKIWNYKESPKEWKFLGDKPVIIDFYADWCGPCKIASPILEEVSKEYAGKLKVYKVNTEQERELAGVFGIQSIPAFLYIPVEGKPVMTAGIGRSKEQTKNMFIQNINKYLLTKK
ncbi:MAG TPA: thioredoxin domain-containing protein [Sunxiuqinia sp.]|nr:thioredoxin domain-containing protein [Sunxiuqinia sp.]